MNQTPEIHVESISNSNDLAAVSKILNEFNGEQGIVYNPQPLAVFTRDNQGSVLAGLSGYTHWGWLRIKQLAVSKDLRQQGLGSRLLQAAESEARNRGCTKSFVDTYTFQAVDFYIKNGYQIFAELDSYPAAEKRVFLAKSL